MYRPSHPTSVRNVGMVRLYKRTALQVKALQEQIENKYDVRLRGEIEEDHPLLTKVENSGLNIVDVANFPSVSFYVRERGKLVKRDLAVKWYKQAQDKQASDTGLMAELRRDLLARCSGKEVERALKL